MKPTRILTSIAAFFAGLALQGCSGGYTPKEIAPGAFVADEPMQVAGKELKDTSKCMVDLVNGKQPDQNGTWMVKRGEEVVFSGWAASNDGTQAVSPMFIRLNGAVETYYAVTTTRGVRPDVNKLLKWEPSLQSGFELRASIAQVEPGFYAVMVMQPVGDRVEGCERTTYSLLVN